MSRTGCSTCDTAGSQWLVILIAVANAVLGVALGLLCSAFARTEFQAVQFMPVVVVPQLLLCGLFVAARPDGRLAAGDQQRAAADVRGRGAAPRSARTPTPTATMWRDLAIVVGAVIARSGAGRGDAAPAHPLTEGRALARRSGRRPGNPDTREAILAAARDAFADKGFDGASIRAIATGAGVDPALVHHYFGTKDQLFLAAMNSPIDPARSSRKAVEGDRAGLGARLVRMFLTVWDSPAGAAGVALMRSAVSNEWTARLLREFLVTQVMRRVLPHLDARPGRGAAARHARREPDGRPGDGPLHHQDRAAGLRVARTRSSRRSGRPSSATSPVISGRRSPPRRISLAA